MGAFVPYKRGTANSISSGHNSTPNNQSHIVSKCLVVRGFALHVSIDQIKQYINSIAGSNVKLLNEPIFINRKSSMVRTVVLEMDNNEFQRLSQENFWHHTLKIREFQGQRWWKNSFSPQSSRNSNAIAGGFSPGFSPVRMTWQ